MKNMREKKLRRNYGIAFLMLLLIEVCIALFVDDNFVRPLIGDMLVVILIYFFVRIIIPEGCRLLPLYVFLFALLVEFLQYGNLVKHLGLEHNTLARVIIGTVFDVRDIGCYAIGCTIMGGYELWRWKRQKCWV